MAYRGLVAQDAIDADAFNAFEAGGWEERATGYDRFFRDITGRFVDPLLDAASVGAGSLTLDLATGPGYVAARAAERGASVVGVDVAEAMISLAQRRYPGLDFRRADAHDLPFDEAAFDAVVGNFLILHLGRPERAVAGFVRVLRPGGRLALTTWDVPDRALFLGVFFEAFAEARASPSEDIPIGPDFLRFSVDEEFDALLRDQGLDDITVRSIAFTHRVASTGELWNGLLGGTVRTSALILRQPEETRRRIRDAFERLAGRFQRGDRLELPVSAKLAAGRKPYAAPRQAR
jgi:ubiquinone/menaquinone biosynthesis C-methylase UbiE